uniref:Uncharacterized protein n=1 Tax=Salix viminalis TaxID=40686 RepID=A0A6N2MZ64_SALVM
MRSSLHKIARPSQPRPHPLPYLHRCYYPAAEIPFQIRIHGFGRTHSHCHEHCFQNLNLHHFLPRYYRFRCLREMKKYAVLISDLPFNWYGIDER